jgi:hypothetical protein
LEARYERAKPAGGAEAKLLVESPCRLRALCVEGVAGAELIAQRVDAFAKGLQLLLRGA